MKDLPNRITRLMKVTFISLFVFSLGLAHTWEIGVKVTDGTNPVVRTICLKKVGGGYSSGHSSANQFYDNPQVNWAADVNDGGYDCNSLEPNLCSDPRISSTGTYRLYAGTYYVQFSINTITDGHDIDFEFNTSTNQWTVTFNNGAAYGNYTNISTGSDNSGGCNLD